MLEMSRLDHFQDHSADRLNGNLPVEDINARLDEMSSGVHEAITASAPKSQPAK
jgi:hypothetical protein